MNKIIIFNFQENKKICNIIHSITGLKNRGVKREKDTPRKQLGILGMRGSAVIVL